MPRCRSVRYQVRRNLGIREARALRFPNFDLFPMIDLQTMPEANPTPSSPYARIRRKKDSRPMYQVLKGDLELEIREGRLKPGQLVPSESALIARYQVSSTTARRCLDELEGEGLLERKRGKGTYVSALAGMLNKDRVAVVVKDLLSLTHPFLATVVGTLELALERAGAHVVIVRARFGEDSADPAAHLLDLLEHEGIEHAFILSNMPLRMIEPLLERGIKCLGVNTRYQDDRIPHISMNFGESVLRSLRELALRGHRSIAILTQEIPMAEVGVLNSASLLAKAYGEIRQEFSDLPEIPNIHQVKALENVEGTVRKIVVENPDVTAFLCWDELAGLEALRALSDLGIRVPEKVSVVGSRLLSTSPIACLDTPLAEVAKRSADAMLAWIQGTRPESQLISPEGFLPRETIGQAP